VLSSDVDAGGLLAHGHMCSSWSYHEVLAGGRCGVLDRGLRHMVIEGVGCCGPMLHDVGRGSGGELFEWCVAELLPQSVACCVCEEVVWCATCCATGVLPYASTIPVGISWGQTLHAGAPSNEMLVEGALLEQVYQH
jgi:hypothetical protein